MTNTPASKSAHGLGRLGVWAIELRYRDPAAIAEAAAELDQLGYGALWFPGGVGGDVLAAIDLLLASSRRAAVATGIINIWKHEPVEIGAWWRGLGGDQQSRVMLGVGVSHGPLIGDAYVKPLAVMTAYLDKLAAEGVPGERCCIAALAPKMLGLAASRTAGSHPYLSTPEHTAFARETMGPDALLAPELHVVMETDPAKARAAARGSMEPYLRLPNYTNNWRRVGFSEDDIANLSDRLVDAVVAWGTVADIGAKVQAHWDAGANHVCLQVVTPDVWESTTLPRDEWRALAALAA